MSWGNRFWLKSVFMHSLVLSVLLNNVHILVMDADRIIVLRKGDIIEQGSHLQLMAKSGYYAELYDTYFRHQSLQYIESSGVVHDREYVSITDDAL